MHTSKDIGQVTTHPRRYVQMNAGTTHAITLCEILRDPTCLYAIITTQDGVHDNRMIERISALGIPETLCADASLFLDRLFEHFCLRHPRRASMFQCLTPMKRSCSSVHVKDTGSPEPKMAPAHQRTKLHVCLKRSLCRATTVISCLP
jgi:hypothetical protein